VLTTSLPAEFTAVLVLAIGLVLLGVLGLLAGPAPAGRASWVRPLALASALATFGLALAGLRQPGYLWRPALVLGAGAALAALARSPAAGALWRRTAPLRGHHARAGLLLLAGGGLLVWQVCAEDSGGITGQGVPPPAAFAEPPDLVRASGGHAYTDAGEEVPLFCAAGDARGEGEQEAGLLRQGGLDRRAIQTAPATPESNCHGWVFAAGRSWVRSAAVEQILKDNRYRGVSRPAPGDLAVFRDESGKVTHSGLVRVADEDGLVLIESKWGKGGRFLHRPDDHPYGASQCGYYRTDRGSHLLRGVQTGDEGSPFFRGGAVRHGGRMAGWGSGT
jgi:hypothetical protein